MPKNKGGRPSKLEVDVVLTLMSELSSGSGREAAARAAGISPATLYSWIRLGRLGDPRFAHLATTIQHMEQTGALNNLALSFALKIR